VQRIRADLGRSTPFIFAQIGRVLTFANDRNLTDHTPGAWDAIRGGQERLSRTLRNVEMTTAVDLELDNKIHISSHAHKTLGRRLALLAARRAYGRREIKPGPRITSVRVTREGAEFCLDIAFGGVNGALRSAGRPSGFSVFRPRGNEAHIIKTRLRGPRSVRLYLHGALEKGVLWYGRGIDPYCNIEDDRGLALPATGPVNIPGRRDSRALSPQ
jgi:sialate O-acetylesterase